MIHPHAGGYIEFADEIDRIVADIPANTAGLCLDTGHLYYSGMDPEAWLRRHAARVDYVHFKDIDAAVYDAVMGEHIAFFAACARGMMCPIGTGVLDYRSIRRALDDIGYAGYITIEQERDPRNAGTSLRDVAAGAGVGYDHLRHLFSQHRGRSLVQYLNEVRMERATTLLAHSRLAAQRPMRNHQRHGERLAVRGGQEEGVVKDDDGAAGVGGFEVVTVQIGSNVLAADQLAAFAAEAHRCRRDAQDDLGGARAVLRKLVAQLLMNGAFSSMERHVGQ